MKMYTEIVTKKIMFNLIFKELWNIMRDYKKKKLPHIYSVLKLLKKKLSLNNYHKIKISLDFFPPLCSNGQS